LNIFAILDVLKTQLWETLSFSYIAFKYCEAKENGRRNLDFYVFFIFIYLFILSYATLKN